MTGARSNSGDGGLALELTDVRFSYDREPVIDNVSISVRGGGTVAVVGPSGCGKSTLLSLVSGLLETDSGRIDRHFHGEPGRHPLTMVFQKDTTLPWLTVEDNIRFYARLKRNGLRQPPWRRLSRKRRAADDPLSERIEMLLRMGGLDHVADRYPNQLSGGMRRRLAFLVAMAPNPEILLLDEPFSSVDEPTRIGIHQDVFEITKAMSTTTLLVTHDLAEAVTLCDQVFVLSAAPARIAEQLAIPFGPERTMLELRERPEYAEVYRHLWRSLSQQISRQQERRAELTA